MLHQFASRYAGVESIETWSISKGVILKENKTRSNRFTVRAVPPNSKMIIPRMIKGTWLDQGPAGSVVVNQKLADTYSEIKINEPFILMIKEKPIELKIVGIIKEFSDSALYMKAADFHKMAEPTNMANALMIKLLKSSGKTQETLAKAIEQDLEKSDLNIRRVIGTQQILVIILDHLDILMLMLSSLAFLVMTVGALGMTSSMSISVMERSKEIAVLRTIGATPQAIKAMLTYEGVAIALMGWLLGVLFSYPVSRMVSDFFGRLILEYPLDYRGSYIGIGLSLAISIVFAILASRIPVKTATQKPIREVISYA
jgi:putative ABC transport system permease protein